MAKKEKKLLGNVAKQVCGSRIITKHAGTDKIFEPIKDH
jgi:hypothetical protein